MKSYYQELEISTTRSFEVIDITDNIKTILNNSAILQGMVTVTSLHTTCALTINENEERLIEDVRNFFLSIAPPDKSYKHNDLHLRVGIPPDEPENAHSHLIAMMLGNGEVVGISDGELILGRYQSILLLELDGPRERRVALQVVGAK
ncbi:MAG: secondary thiamine-phosphate synthase enzyme YjbQ [Candidatus Thiodiazotropha sp.]